MSIESIRLKLHKLGYEGNLNNDKFSCERIKNFSSNFLKEVIYFDDQEKLIKALAFVDKILTKELLEKKNPSNIYISKDFNFEGINISVDFDFYYYSDYLKIE